MKVKELIEELQKLPQELDVVLARDAEGNGFHYFSGDVTIAHGAKRECGWGLEIATEGDWNDFCEERAMEGTPYPGANVVVLWP